jgi:hypothetical protein
MKPTTLVKTYIRLIPSLQGRDNHTKGAQITIPHKIVPPATTLIFFENGEMSLV